MAVKTWYFSKCSKGRDNVSNHGSLSSPGAREGAWEKAGMRSPWLCHDPRLPALGTNRCFTVCATHCLAAYALCRHTHFRFPFSDGVITVDVF